HRNPPPHRGPTAKEYRMHLTMATFPAGTPQAVSAALTPEATVELLELVRRGDHTALDRLLERCIPALRRWARGRLPQSARGMNETADLVQDAVLACMRRLDVFEVRHQGALQAYFRQAVMNRILDIVRQQKRRPDQADLPEHLLDARPSPLDEAIGSE